MIFDGASKNIGMVEKLGCNIRHLEGLFLNPCQTSNKIQYLPYDKIDQK